MLPLVCNLKWRQFANEQPFIEVTSGELHRRDNTFGFNWQQQQTVLHYLLPSTAVFCHALLLQLPLLWRATVLLLHLLPLICFRSQKASHSKSWTVHLPALKSSRAKSRYFTLSCLCPTFLWRCCSAPTGHKTSRVREGCFKQQVTLRSLHKWGSLPLSFSVSQLVPKSLIIHIHTSTQNLTGVETDCSSAGNRSFSKMHEVK